MVEKMRHWFAQLILVSFKREPHFTISPGKGPLGAWPMCWAASLDVTWLSGGAQTSLLGMAEDAPGDAVGEVVACLEKNAEVYRWLKKKMEGLLVVVSSFWMFLVLNWQNLECFFQLSCFSFVRCFCSSISFRSVQSDFLPFSLKFR